MDDLSATINQIVRQDRGRLLSALIGKFRNFDLAEDALQEALVSASVHWGRSGLPANPAAWLYTAAGRKAIDYIRKNTRDTHLVDELIKIVPMSQPAPYLHLLSSRVGRKVAGRPHIADLRRADHT